MLITYTICDVRGGLVGGVWLLSNYIIIVISERSERPVLSYVLVVVLKHLADLKFDAISDTHIYNLLKSGMLQVQARGFIIWQLIPFVDLINKTSNSMWTTNKMPHENFSTNKANTVILLMNEKSGLPTIIIILFDLIFWSA